MDHDEIRRLAHLVALLLLASASGCDGCGTHGDTGPGPDKADGATTGVPEPWTLGATRRQPALALPPPCVSRADSLRGVLSRQTQIAAEPHTLGRALIAEGASLPTWRRDSTGLMTMGHGRTRVVPMPWLGGEPPLLAYADGADRWLAGPGPRAAGDGLWLWRGGVWERLAEGDAAQAKGLLCAGVGCALLVTPLGTAAAGGRPGGATVLVGRADEPLHSWERFDVATDQPQARPLGVEAIEPVAEDDWQVTVTLRDDLRVRFYRLGRGKPPELLGVIGAPARVLDATTTPVAMAMTAPTVPAGKPCAPDAGGVTIATRDREEHLRSALPAEGGVIRSLPRGVIALWSAPTRCDGRERTVYGTVLHAGGPPVAPVTALAQGDDYAVATAGDEVDLWVVQDRTVTWVRARCSLPPAALAPGAR